MDGQLSKWTPENLNEFKEFSNQVTHWIGHNFLAYDRPVLNRLLGTDIKVKDVTDTLILSRLFNPLREKGQSLERWGRVLGFPKQEHEDWSQFSLAMLQRCETDVELNYKLYNHLLNEGKTFSSQSIRLEHSVQYVLQQQKEHGFLLDQKLAQEILVSCKSEMNRIEELVYKDFKPKYKLERVVTPRVKKDGTYSTVGLNGFSIDDIGGQFSKLKIVPFNLGSPTQIVERMEEYGWKPTVFGRPTPNQKLQGMTKGSPKVCEENINSLPDTAPESAKLLSTYLMCRSRVSTVEGWFKTLQSDGRIHGDVISIGAVTHRMAHTSPNMANIPSVSHDKEGKPVQGIEGGFGYECRKSFIVPDNKLLVGVDAKAIQLRILAHYMDDEGFIKAVYEGDPHTFNQNALGLSSHPTGRAIAKTFIYAFLLGAGDAKLGLIVGGGAKEGRELKERFLASLPALARLKVRTERDAKRGYMIGLDGRHIPVKSAHFALSSYLQGGETIIMKTAYVNSYNRFKREKLDAMFTAIVHDEFQIEAHKDIAEYVGEIVKNEINNTTYIYNLKCPMEGDARIGKSWYETH